ncbi:MAG TPA: hypothetical protein PKE29_03725 [Phycisphaerales bacterium]|nr:hypothetical protein [Phycisphaerales bacterium]
MGNKHLPTPEEETRLTPDGARRRAAIGSLLATTARNRRTGRTILASGSGLAVLICAFVAIQALSPRHPPGKDLTQNPDPGPRTEPWSVPPTPATIHIAIVTNQPLPDRPCSESSSASSSGVPICILDDDHLLRVLNRTGESYGLVRIGGRTEVVLNSR